MDVWLVETDDYPEDALIFGVASSVERAAAYIRSRYPAPYIVEWDEPVELDKGEWAITGHFKAVPGYSGSGPLRYLFTRYTVDEYR